MYRVDLLQLCLAVYYSLACNSPFQQLELLFHAKDYSPCNLESNSGKTLPESLFYRPIQV